MGLTPNLRPRAWMLSPRALSPLGKVGPAASLPFTRSLAR